MGPHQQGKGRDAMGFRHEWKHILTTAGLIALRTRLGAVLETDPHAAGGRYTIRSLYFDTPGDKALREKLDGVDQREKFRLRYYNGDTGLVLLEKKSKVNGLCQKEQQALTLQDVQALLGGEWAGLPEGGGPLLGELGRKMRIQGLGPKTLVDYTREPFIYGPGNVRVTLDYGLRTGLSPAAFLEPGCPTVPVPGAPVGLEVNGDAYRPARIRDLVQTPGARSVSFSKYAACRVVG